jgi:5-carboxymethyl-2-hydroxymuconate isomerase
LAVLDLISLAGLPRGRELQVVRGELRIKAGRCPEGKRDLGDVLEKGVADALAERAVRAIHHCP